MDLLDQQLSTQVYHYVSNIIGTEDVVKRRRQLFTALDINNSGSEHTFISSGSKAEGLDLHKSDLDIMFCSNIVRVFENYDVLHSSSETVKLMMETEMTKPGFTLLKLFNSRQNLFKVFRNDFRTCERDSYFPSTHFNDKLLNDIKLRYNNQSNSKIHGPCISSSDDGIDTAPCFRCYEWVSPAHSWVYRTRNSWPKNELICRIIDCGVLFVPIGCKGSPNEHLEWRISFSLSEKKLIHSFSHVQFLCYALLKIILVDLIKPNYGDLICSYFLKTIMFWLCEEYDQNSWKPYNFNLCFMSCLKRLLYCVEHETLLHYFIPDNNFFENRFTAVQHKKLLNTLRSIYTLGWRCILHTETFKTFYSVIPTNSLNFRQASSIGSISVLKAFAFNMNFKAALPRLIFGLPNKAMHAYLLSVYSQSVSQQMSLDINTTSNKFFFKQYKKCRSYLLEGINTDAVSGWLYLASFYYTCKQYHQCIYITDYCISKCTPHKILLSYKPDTESQSIFERLLVILGRRQYFTLVKDCLLDSVTYSKSSTLLPTELQYYFDTENIHFFPPVVFAYFLKFLCCHHLHDSRGKHLTFRDLELVVAEQYFVLNRRKIVQNANICLMIAQSLMNEHDYTVYSD